MPEAKSILVNALSLDLSNFRTVPQADEVHAIKAMISISPDRFWALMESLIQDGYLPTENILVLNENPSKLVVKEGNRRIAALKLIFGYISDPAISIPKSTSSAIFKLTPEWKRANEHVPCSVYPSKEAVVVDRIVTLAHGKGEKAGRDQWGAVARARHNRDVGKSNEHALDLLEKYLTFGKNLSASQKERWAGDYPLTVLDEAIKRIATRFGFDNAPNLAKGYPKIKHLDALESILKDIGLEQLRFKTIRDKSKNFADTYGLSQATPPTSSESATSNPEESSASSAKASDAANTQSQSEQETAFPSEQGGQNSQASTGKAAATAINDPKSVTDALKKFKPVGSNREKVVTLRDEAIRLVIKNNPLAFCFLLRR